MNVKMKVNRDLKLPVISLITCISYSVNNEAKLLGLEKKIIIKDKDGKFWNSFTKIKTI